MSVCLPGSLWKLMLQVGRCLWRAPDPPARVTGGCEPAGAGARERSSYKRTVSTLRCLPWPLMLLVEKGTTSPLSLITCSCEFYFSTICFLVCFLFCRISRQPCACSININKYLNEKRSLWTMSSWLCGEHPQDE